ncbi:WXG100 family type VII secretion target [Micromonospora globbae]|uniref:WXG100 family type VII secretion target n=1 Tax=Micromonospora globbae TaxID=1894969 RepID=UPI0034299AF3
MSEYTQRYEGASHQELYDAVMAGKPGQIDDLAADWSSLKGTVEALGRDLGDDLEKLSHTWTGSAAQEFQRRLTYIVDYAGTLGEGMADVKQALTMMAGQLRTAQRSAESPEETDDHDQALSGAVKGGIIFGVPGAVVGGLLGHQQDKEEQQKAHQRMIKVVADLAEGYDLSAYGRVVAPPPPDPDLPGTVDGSGPAPRSGPNVGTPTTVAHLGAADPQTGRASISTPEHVSSGPTSTHGGGGGLTTVGGGAPTPASVTGPGSGEPEYGTSLAGAGPLTNSTLMPGGGGPGGVGLAGAGTGTAGAGVLGATGMSPGAGLVGTAALAGSSSTAPTTTGRPAGGPAGPENRSATGVGRSFDGRRGDGTSRGAAATRPGVLGGRGQQDEDESDERLTWLTEDEMVWGDGKDAAPPVLGG